MALGIFMEGNFDGLCSQLESTVVQPIAEHFFFQWLKKQNFWSPTLVSYAILRFIVIPFSLVSC